jgi:hypothetical protein
VIGGTWEEIAGAGADTGVEAGALGAVQFVPVVDAVVDGIVLAAVVGSLAVSLSGDAVRGAHAKSEAKTRAKAATTPCSDCEPPDCKEAQKKIKKGRDELKKRYAEMRKDKEKMYPINPEKTLKGSWQGHIDQFLQKQKNLRKNIINAQTNGCSVPEDAWKWATEKPPTKPAPSEPDS